MKVFPLLRPEKSVWYRVGILAWIVVFGWLWVVRYQLKTGQWLFVAIMVLFGIARDLRLRRTPNRRVEIDGESIRLFPEGYWVVDMIPRRAILGRRDEGKEFFVHFDDAGVERAVVFERGLFERERWEELLVLLKEGTRALPVEY